MNALTEFINTCLDLEIQKVISEINQNQDKNRDLTKRLKSLNDLRFRLNCFEGTGEVIEVSSSDEEEQHEEEEEKHEEEEEEEEPNSDTIKIQPSPAMIPLPEIPGLLPYPPLPETPTFSSDETESEDDPDNLFNGDFGKYRKTPFVVLRPVLERKEKGLYFKLWRLWDHIMKQKGYVSNHLKIAMGKAYEVVFDRLNAKSQTIKDFKKNIGEAYDMFRDIYNQMEDDYEDKELKRKLSAQRKAFTELKDDVMEL